ncbi:MAG TPA: universal stress protein [Ilumatobacter sp.]
MRNLVVGVDGAPASRHALDWAVAAVGPDGALHLVAASEPASGFVAGEPPERVGAALRRAVTALAAEAVGDRVATVTVTASAACAADALGAAAQDHAADAIVVGAHVAPRAAPRRIGATIRHLLDTLATPLVVVPSGPVGALDAGGPVIVGVGHGDATHAAVRWAARLAAERELAIGLVRATGEQPVFDVDGLLNLLAYYIDPAQRAVWTREDLAMFAAEAQAVTDPEIAIGTTAVPGRPAHRLVDASATATLLVIGRHRSMLTGDAQTTRSLRHALTHARCPVVVIPADGADGRGGTPATEG